MRRLDRVLYLDLDAHHGDGVESAFYTSDRVLTLSIHAHGPGIYPATGCATDSGPASPAPAAHRALNIPIPETGLSDASLLRLFDTCVQPVRASFRPDAVVVQCGADGLAGDPCRLANLSSTGMARVVERVLGWNVPTLLLGGGGYAMASAAICWAGLTAVALKLEPSTLSTLAIPEHDYAEEYADSAWQLEVAASGQPDLNTSLLDGIEVAFRTAAGLDKVVE